MADNHLPNVKLEPFHHVSEPAAAAAFIELSSSNSDDSGGNESGDLNYIIDSILRDNNKAAVSLDFDDVDVAGGGTSTMFQFPVDFLAPVPPPPLPPPPIRPSDLIPEDNFTGNVDLRGREYKQFWKAGDYEGASCGVWDANSVGMDHVRVHPKFLHSNATSHKWALGAFAELLDNALDEACSGATYANIDMLQNSKDGNRMLLIEDDGGGMDPDKIRQCMSLGYSAKSKMANTIGQYGNGFKTSTMRLGADVIVLSRSMDNGGKRFSPTFTQSIGLLSYTFLRSTGKEDIVVPMLDYEKREGEWNKIIRGNPEDWDTNVETIVQWSPFSDEAELLRQFNSMKEHGTRIIIYNIWEDDQGLLELDFDTDKYDILLRGVNRDEKNIQMANQFPNSRHFLTYRHSLRSYASILYLRLPAGFRFVIRGKDVEHHNIVNDMMITQEVTYRPQPGSDGINKNLNLMAVVTIGFVKDAVHHIDVQGFNVYHKNRLIKPFWRIWKPSSSDGRGVIGVLEANFVEPAHDKQGFERTNVLARLEARLLQMQRTYWNYNCHKIGYAPKNIKNSNASSQDTGMFDTPKSSDGNFVKGQVTSNLDNVGKSRSNSGKKASLSEWSSSSDDANIGERLMKSCSQKKEMLKNPNGKKSTTVIPSSLNSEVRDGPTECRPNQMHIQPYKTPQSKGGPSDGRELAASKYNTHTIDQLRKENFELMERLEKKDEDISKDLMVDLHQTRERHKLLETQVQELQQKIEDKNSKQEDLIRVISEERGRRAIEEENLRKELKNATNTIQELLRQMRS